MKIQEGDQWITEGKIPMDQYLGITSGLKPIDSWPTACRIDPVTTTTTKMEDTTIGTIIMRNKAATLLHSIQLVPIRALITLLVTKDTTTLQLLPVGTTLPITTPTGTGRDMVGPKASPVFPLLVDTTVRISRKGTNHDMGPTMITHGNRVGIPESMITIVDLIEEEEVT
jgi:hypothetical protein